MAAVARAAVVLLVLSGCSTNARPVALSSGDACAHCRMAVSDARFAGQVAAPGEEPLFYDDIGCLMRAIAGGQPVDHAYVADHRTREWVPAARAVFTRVAGLATPMGSHLIAHANEESRTADPAAAAGERRSVAEALSDLSSPESPAPSPEPRASSPESRAPSPESPAPSPEPRS